MSGRPGCIVVLAPDAGGGGSLASAARRHAHLLAARHDVVLMGRSVPADVPAGLETRAVEARRFPWLRRLAHVPDEWALAQAVRRALHSLAAERPIALVLCHSHSLAALAAIPAGSRLGFPVALVVHANVFSHPRGTYDPRLMSFYRKVSPRACRKASWVVAVSGSLAAASVRLGARAERVVVVPNGLDAAEIGLDGPLPGAGRRDSGGPLALLYVGRLGVEKGVGVLVEAAGLLRSRGIAFTLRLVGEGPLRARLERQARALGLGEVLSFAGPLPRRALGPVYAAADLTCVPSLSEGQGVVVLESLLAGTPVAGAAVGGIPEMIRDGVDGLLVEPGRAAAWAEAIGRVAGDRGVLSRMSGQGRARVLERYSWEAVGATLQGAVEQMTLPGGAPSSEGRG